MSICPPSCGYCPRSIGTVGGLLSRHGMSRSPRAASQPRATSRATSQATSRGRATGERRLSGVPARVGLQGGHSRRWVVPRLERRQWGDSPRIRLEPGLSPFSSTMRSLSRLTLHYRRMDLTLQRLSASNLDSQRTREWCPSFSRSNLRYQQVDLTPGWLSASKLHSRRVADTPLCSWLMARIHIEAPNSPCSASNPANLTLPPGRRQDSYRLGTLHIVRKWRTCKVDV